jgi:hypothetical protein
MRSKHDVQLVSLSSIVSGNKQWEKEAAFSSAKSDSDSERRQHFHTQKQLTLARDGLQEEIDRVASALCSETLERERNS